MKRIATGALALAAVGSAAFANTPDSDWLELDREINSLASAVSTQGPIAGWAVLLRSSYTFSSDDLATNGGSDVSGWKLEDVRIAAWGEVGDYGWRVSYNFDFGVGLLEDAFAWWLCGEYFTARMGQYVPNTLRSARIYEENLLFISRTLIGDAFYFYDQGIGARGEYNEFAWSIDVMNGSNGQEADHDYALRGEYRLNGGAGDVEGANGASDDLVGTIGLFYFNSDVILGDAMVYGLDLAGTQGPLSVSGEYIDVGDDIAALTGSSFRLANPLVLDADSNPFALTISYMISLELEAAIRYQDTDNGLDQTALTLGVIWYNSGMLARWNAEITSISGDDIGALDGDATVFQVGMSVGNSH